MKTLLHLVVVSLLLIPAYASADYSVFELNPIPPGASMATPLVYQMVGIGSGQSITFNYSATGTVTQFDRVTVPVCRYLGANGGVIDLEVRTTATSGPIVASSSLTVNSGNVWSTGCTSSIVNATTSTWVLNQNVQWVNGVEIFFTFHYRGTTGSFYNSFVMNGYDGETYIDGIPLAPYSGKTYNFSASGLSLGIPPVVYSASSSNIVCDTFDFGCYISTAFSTLFMPTSWTFDRLSAINHELASSSPFGYAYEVVDIVNTALSTTSSSFVLSADLSDFSPQFVSATSVPIVSSAGIRDFIGPSMWDIVQNVFELGLWLSLLSYFWIRFREIV